VLTGVALFAREGMRWRDLTHAAEDVEKQGGEAGLREVKQGSEAGTD